MKHKNTGATTLTAALAAGLIGAAPQAAAEDDWEFMIAPLFLWAQGIEGSSTVNGKEAPLDLDFTDEILDNLEAAFSVHFEGRKGDWGFWTEWNYVDLGPDAEIVLGPGQEGKLDADVTFKEHLFELGGTWMLSENDRTRWELMFGGRYIDQEINVKAQVTGPLPPELPGQRFDGGDDWMQAVGGVRVFHQLSDSWTFTSRFDLGYGGSDNSALNFVFMFDWRFNDWGSAFIGGKFMQIDYEDRSYGFDADRAGPLMGISIWW